MLGFCQPRSGEVDLETKLKLPWGPGPVPDLGCDLREFSLTPFKSRSLYLQKRDDST